MLWTLPDTILLATVAADHGAAKKNKKNFVSNLCISQIDKF